MGGAALEEALSDALLQAGGVLAEALREGLLVRGLDADLSVRAEEGRVTVVSRSRAVRAAELGEAGQAPSAPLSGIARVIEDDVVGALRSHLREALR